MFLKPRFEKSGGLHCIWVVCLSYFRHSVRPSYYFLFSSEFNEILYVHLYWHVLAWDFYATFFGYLCWSYGPWFTPKFHFCSLSWQQIDRLAPNFIYAFTLTRSSLGLLHIIFCIFILKLWSLIYSKISFPLNIWRTNRQIWQTIYTGKIYVGIVSWLFSRICTSVIALDLRQNFVYVQYHENKWTEFHQILYMHSYGQDLSWECHISFLHTCTGIMVLNLRRNFVSVQYLEKKWTEFTKFYKCIHIDKIYAGNITNHFLHIGTRVMVLN